VQFFGACVDRLRLSRRYPCCEPETADGPAEADGIERGLTCDVLVIGSGAGGFSTAVTAKEHGLDAVVVEKAPGFGGTTTFGGFGDAGRQD
jgi:NADPH-dependent 2,4-dienoyl-CoA reductase/sulfur reductase-like enzyme